MQITLAVEFPQQVRGACRTTAHHIRIGSSYCSLVAQQTWPIKELKRALLEILAAGKKPQLVLPACPLEESEEKYWQQNKQLLKDFPKVEVIISNWGLLKFPVLNHKIASTKLNVLSSQQVALLREHGVKVVALPLNLREGEHIRRLIKNSPKIKFEYQLDGEVLTGSNWLCQAEPDTNPKPNGNWCLTPKTFTSSVNKFLPGIQTRGNTAWTRDRMATLQQVQDLASWGVSRGVINWGRYDLTTIEQLITLYQVVLSKGTTVIEDNKFYQELRKQISFHYFN